MNRSVDLERPDGDGDLVIINHGFDLNDKHIRPHEVCSHNVLQSCEQDSDCGVDPFCNNISYLGLDEILLPMGKAVAANTYSASGWAVFESAKALVTRLFSHNVRKVVDQGLVIDYKSKLQELVQARRQERPSYRIVEAAGAGPRQDVLGGGGGWG